MPSENIVANTDKGGSDGQPQPAPVRLRAVVVRCARRGDIRIARARRPHRERLNTAPRFATDNPFTFIGHLPRAYPACLGACTRSSPHDTDLTSTCLRRACRQQLPRPFGRHRYCGRATAGAAVTTRSSHNFRACTTGERQSDARHSRNASVASPSLAETRHAGPSTTARRASAAEGGTTRAPCRQGDGPDRMGSTRRGHRAHPQLSAGLRHLAREQPIRALGHR